jgi:electron transport complex protein RnfE
MKTEFPARSPESVATAGSDDIALFGICPLLGAVVSVIAGAGLGVALLVMLCVASGLVAAAHGSLPARARLPATLVLMAALATAIGVLFEAFLFDAWLALGIALPLLATNAAILEHTETSASRVPPRAAVTSALAVGARVVLWMMAVGAARELLGSGALFTGAGSYGERFGAWTVHLLRADKGFALALAPAGGFLVLGLMLGARNAIATRRRRAADDR